MLGAGGADGVRTEDLGEGTGARGCGNWSEQDPPRFLPQPAVPAASWGLAASLPG